MTRNIVLVLIGKRNDAAVNVQKILTGWGCFIKTRLGIHDGVLENCSDEGLLFLEMVGDTEKHEELVRKLKLIKSVDAKLIKLELTD
ncbi:MAG: hypothetical protein ACLFQX_03095 [Candidatus Kapaibacterium sp.]